MKPEVIIVISQKELFIGGAQLILKQVQGGDFGCQIVFIDDLLSVGHKIEHNNSKKIFYFLTNVAGVMECVQNILRKGHVVVNKNFLLGENSKFYLQKIIEKNGVIIPKSICPVNNKDIYKIELPCYVKSQKQSSTVVKVVNKKEFDEAICLFDSNEEDWYLEHSC